MLLAVTGVGRAAPRRSRTLTREELEPARDLS